MNDFHDEFRDKIQCKNTIMLFDFFSLPLDNTQLLAVKSTRLLFTITQIAMVLEYFVRSFHM